MKHYILSQEMDGMRLDVTLASLLQCSRAEAQKRIAAGAVHVRGAIAKNNTRVHEGDTVCIEEEIRAAVSPVQREDPKILYEDDDVIVLCKPVGLVVHPSREHPEGTLADFLCRRYPEIAKVGDDPNRPGIVHRLDKDASGVMVIARNEDSFDSLKRQFKLHHVEKDYYAICYGALSPLEGTISLRLGRKNSSPKIVARSTGGREATTHYWVEKKAKFCSLVRLKIETGRTHQIRAHLYAVGHPLVGDTVYASKKIRPIPAPRLMLHAYRLEFANLSGEKRTFECAVPKEFDAVLTHF